MMKTLETDLFPYKDALSIDPNASSLKKGDFRFKYLESRFPLLGFLHHFREVSKNNSETSEYNLVKVAFTHLCVPIMKL